MRLTTRGKLAAYLTTVTAGAIFLLPSDGLDDLGDSSGASPANSSQPCIRVYEDGSGVEYAGSKEITTWPADTFRWPVNPDDGVETC